MESLDGKALEEKLLNNKKSGWENINEEEKNIIFKFSDEYMSFLNKSKTEREFVESSKEVLEANRV